MPILIAIVFGLFFVLGCGGSSAPPSIPPAPEMPEPPPEQEPFPTFEPEPSVPSETGAYDPCAGKACGDTCQLCPPGDSDCVETAVLKQCNASGVCTHEAADCP